MRHNIEQLARLQDDERECRGNARASTAQSLTQLAASAELFHTLDGETFARICLEGHVETWPMKSKEVRQWLIHQFYQVEGKPPGAKPIQDALDMLAARARYEGACQRVHLRVAEHGGAVYVDLINDAWEAIEVTREGWRIVVDPPVRFRRTRGMTALPHPCSGGGLDLLRPFVNVSDETQWQLLVGWLLSTFRPVGPYPVLVLQGEQGSAKSTLARCLRLLVDPSLSPLRTLPHDERDLMIAAKNAWVLSFDNLSGISGWLSDAFCRLSTGGGFAIRQLYTDEDEIIFDAQRPVILNGIDDVATRQDLIDRVVVLSLASIPEQARQTETEFWKRFAEVRPLILGALLDAVSAALQNLPRVALSSKPRMADFAEWVTAAAPSLGWQEGTFLAAYLGNRTEAVELGLDASPIASALRKSMDGHPDWTGTAEECLQRLTTRVEVSETKAKGWPQTPRALSSQLRRVMTALRAVGLEIVFYREGHTRRRLISIRHLPSLTGSSVPTVPTEDSVAIHGDDGDANHWHSSGDGTAWPSEISGLGPRRIAAFDRCSLPDCPNWTFASYGSKSLCRRHAWEMMESPGAPT